MLTKEIFTLFDFAGTLVFAISGALAAINKRLDPLGVAIIGFVTAIAGGTTRDVLIGRTPVTWMGELNYVYLIFAGVAIAIFFHKKIEYLRKTLFLFDTIGLGVFTIIGVEAGLQTGLSPIICVMLGMITASFGGVVRDILCNEVPVILHREIYASASIVGAALYLVLHPLNIPEWLLYLCPSAVVIAIRLLAVKYSWTLPRPY